MLRVDAFLSASDYPGQRSTPTPRPLPKEQAKAAAAPSFEEALRQAQRKLA